MPNDLVLLLHRTRPRAIFMQGTSVIFATCKGVFEYITSPQPGIDCVLLHGLGEDTSGTNVSLWFPEARTLPRSRAEGEIGGSSLARTGNAVRRPIDYRCMSQGEYVDLNMRAFVRGHVRKGSCVFDTCTICRHHISYGARGV
jgi:hypothetical protein